MASAGEVAIRRLDATAIEAQLEALAALLIDAVESGASVGFLPPLHPEAARDYWRGVARATGAGSRIVLAAFEQDALQGSVQLDLPGMPNGSHRAEVMKLFVARAARGRGIATALMRAIEEQGRLAGRRLLVLDTRQGDSAERLYTGLGYSTAGVIPRYARSASGELDATVILYRWLE